MRLLKFRLFQFAVLLGAFVAIDAAFLQGRVHESISSEGVREMRNAQSIVRQEMVLHRIRGRFSSFFDFK